MNCLGDFDQRKLLGTIVGIVGSNLISSSISGDGQKTYSYQFIVYIDGSVYINTNMIENSMGSNLMYSKN